MSTNTYKGNPYVIPGQGGIYSNDHDARVAKGIGPDYDYSKLTTGADGRGHYTDAGKLPWHPTFSQESRYSSPSFLGGRWTVDSAGKDVFTPSMDMINAGYTKGLANYMKVVEGDVGAKLGVTPPMSKKAFDKAVK